MLIARLRLGLFLATFVASLHVAAAPRFWTLTGVQFEDGAVATGYFSYDDATRTFANWNVRVSGGVAPFIPWTYVPANSNLWVTNAALYVYSSLPSLVPGFWWRSLVIDPSLPLDGSSAMVPINISASHDFFENDYDGGDPFGRVGPSRKIIAGSLALTTAPPPTQRVDINQHGLTGSWYNPATSGQGIQLEVYPNMVAPGTGFLQGGWMTFGYVSPADFTAGAGATCGYWDYGCDYPAPQRWYTFSGNVTAGQSSATLLLYKNVGGNFNALPATSAVVVGTVKLSFEDCTTTTMDYVFSDGSNLSGTIPLVRLMPNVTCSSSGDHVANVDFGYSGNWFDPTISGQGLGVELNPNAGVFFFTWYTYDEHGQFGDPGQRWFTGQGNYVPGSRSLAVTLYETTGGLFDSGLAVAQSAPIGTATATFLSCDAARLTFVFGGNAGRSGTINLSRVGHAPADCLQ